MYVVHGIIAVQSFFFLTTAALLIRNEQLMYALLWWAKKRKEKRRWLERRTELVRKEMFSYDSVQMKPKSKGTTVNTTTYNMDV